MKTVPKRICVATGSRAEYGLLKPLIEELDAHFDVHILITGQHLSPEYGSTYQEIYADILKTHKVEMLLSSDTPVGTCKSMGLGLISYGEMLNVIRPDLLVVLGDRFEIFAVATAAHILRIPIAHIHGGEITEGSFDNALRHSITMMARYHLVSTEWYGDNIFQMREMRSEGIFTVGALGLDDLPEPAEIKNDRLMLIYHPVTMLEDGGLGHLEEMLECLDGYDVDIIGANSDPGGRRINGKLLEFAALSNYDVTFADTYRRDDFLRMLNTCKALVGNSSCGILEAPSLKVWTINVGPRQEGRIQATSVINCEDGNITEALEKVYSRECIVMSPYGGPGAARRITNILREVI